MIELVDVAAAYRLTRLATADTITRPARARVIAFAYGTDEWKWPNDTVPVGGIGALSEIEWDRRPLDDDTAPKLAEFVKCRWCAGLWISGFVVVARRYAPRVWDPLARVLALSAGAALLARLEDE